VRSPNGDLAPARRRKYGGGYGRRRRRRSLRIVVGLLLINHFAPTVGGRGPDGAAAFVGLVGGIVVVGLIMWAASD